MGPCIVLMYSSIANKMQRYTIVFTTINVLHVSGVSSAHHQELKTVYTALGIYQAFSASYCYCEWVGTGLCREAFLPPIIRSSKLCTQRQVFVKLFLLLTAIVSELELVCACTCKPVPAHKKLDKYPMFCIQFRAPDHGRKKRLKHVEHL